MKTELLLFGLLPAAVALGSIIVSVYVAFRARSPFQFLAGSIVTAGAAWSLLVLYRIFVRGAWPTYLPHMVIGAVLVIVVAQAFFSRSKDHEPT